MAKDTNIIFRVDSNLKDAATKIANDNGYRLTDILTASLCDFVKRKKVPIFLCSFLPSKHEKNNISIILIKKTLEEIISKENNRLIRKAYLFGSFARGDENNSSDIDIRIEADRGLTLIDLGNIRQDLADSLKREIDLICCEKENLDPDFYNSIKKDEICLYER